jgi:H+-translocating NAD(P) transhydrogenase subunit beta
VATRARSFSAHPTTARRGVTTGEIGLALAIAGTLVHHEIVSYTVDPGRFVAGSAIGIPLAVFMPMTHVPQRTARSHALGARGDHHVPGHEPLTKKTA